MNVGSNLLQQWVGCNTNDQFLDMVLSSENSSQYEEKQVLATRKEKALIQISKYLDSNRNHFNHDDLESLNILRGKVLWLDPSSNNEIVSKIDSIRGSLISHVVSDQKETVQVEPSQTRQMVNFTFSFGIGIGKLLIAPFNCCRKKVVTASLQTPVQPQSMQPIAPIDRSEIPQTGQTTTEPSSEASVASPASVSTVFHIPLEMKGISTSIQPTVQAELMKQAVQVESEQPEGPFFGLGNTRVDQKTTLEKTSIEAPVSQVPGGTISGIPPEVKKLDIHAYFSSLAKTKGKVKIDSADDFVKKLIQVSNYWSQAWSQTYSTAIYVYQMLDENRLKRWSLGYFKTNRLETGRVFVPIMVAILNRTNEPKFVDKIIPNTCFKKLRGPDDAVGEEMVGHFSIGLKPANQIPFLDPLEQINKIQGDISVEINFADQ